MSQSATKKVFENVDVLDDVEDDEEIFKNQL